MKLGPICESFTVRNIDEAVRVLEEENALPPLPRCGHCGRAIDVREPHFWVGAKKACTRSCAKQLEPKP